MSYFLESLLDIDDDNISILKEEDIDFSSECNKISSEMDEEYYSFIRENKYNSIIGSSIVFNEFLSDDNIIKKFAIMCKNFLQKFLALIDKGTVSLVKLATTSKRFVKMYKVDIAKAARLGTVEYEGYEYTIHRGRTMADRIKNYSSKIIFNNTNIVQDTSVSRGDFIRGELFETAPKSEAECKKYIAQVLRNDRTEPVKLIATDAAHIMDVIINDKHLRKVGADITDSAKKIVEKQISDLESNKNLDSSILEACIRDMKICISSLNILGGEIMTAIKEEFKQCKKLVGMMVRSVQDGRLIKVDLEWVPEVKEYKD